MTLKIVLGVLFLALAVHAAVQPFHVAPSCDDSGYIRKMEREARLRGEQELPAQWFVQRLDHFNAQDNRMWKQRYFVNDTFWSKVQIGGEGAISEGYVKYMQMVLYGKQYNAMLVALEHRFYGQSNPLKTLATANLAYLSSHQALADAALFITSFKKSIGAEDSPVIVFGCSYPGNLAGWFRMKYPHLTAGSIASSAPVQATLDFFEYLDVVDKSLTFFTGPQCDALIGQATDQIQDLIKSTDGRAKLRSMFNLCQDISTDNDVANFMATLMGNWQGTVQYNDESPFSPNINKLCSIMEANPSTPLTSYINIAKMFSGGQCIDIAYENMVKELQDVNDFGGSGAGARQWTYQTCAEFGYFQTTDSDRDAQPFGNLVPVEFYVQLCKDVFGVDFNTEALIDNTNAYYGGHNLPSYFTSNIMFVNGNIDPWHALGVIEDVSATTKAILINGTAHCANTQWANNRSPPSLISAQQKIATQIGQWLSSVKK